MEWKLIENLDSKYSVSNTGLIRNNKSGRILKQHLGKTGYMVISFKPYGKNGKALTLKVHRLVANAFVPQIEGKIFVNHKDGIKTNNVWYNLEWVTKSENTIHAMSHGLLRNLFENGESHAQVKLSDSDVKYIREVYRPRHNEFGARALGRYFNVDHSTIVKIANGSER